MINYLILVLLLSLTLACSSPPPPREVTPEPVPVEEPKKEEPPKEDINFDELKLMKVKIIIYLLNGSQKSGFVVGVNKDHVTGGITELEIKGSDDKIFVVLRKDIKQVSPEFIPHGKK